VTAIAAQSDPACDSSENPVSRYEFWAIVAITFLGAAVRFAFPSAMAIEHFDEGVYASNLLFPDQGNEFPHRHLYAPSLVPALIEWSIILFGDKGIAPMLPSLLFGTLTIPLIWWVARQWSGPLAGIAAAILLSLNDFHIAFSRSALTDVLLCFWLLLAVYFFERAFRNLSWVFAVAAGITTGFAWWTKYNGWLPLAISLSGLLAWSLLARRDERHVFHRLGLWSVAATTALVVWSPYWLSLPNGYAEVARNHSQYVVGFAGWWNGATQQIDAWKALPSVVASFFCCFLAVLSAGCFLTLSCDESRSEKLRSSVDPRQVSFAAICLSGFGAIGILTGLNSALVLASLLQLAVASWITFREVTSASKSTDRFLCFRFGLSDLMLAAWVGGLILTTPLYRPYPRLTLPLVLGTHLMFGHWFAALRFEGRTNPSSKHIGYHAVVITMLLTVIGPLLSAWPKHPPKLILSAWLSRNELAQISQRMIRDVNSLVEQQAHRPNGPTRAVLYVYAEPGLFFHLPAEGLAVQPAGNLNFVEIEATQKLPTFLVTGPHARRIQAFADEFAKRAEQFELIARYPYDASDFVRLDDVSATQLRAHREPLEVRLYRVRVPK